MQRTQSLKADIYQKIFEILATLLGISYFNGCNLTACIFYLPLTALTFQATLDHVPIKHMVVGSY